MLSVFICISFSTIVATFSIVSAIATAVYAYIAFGTLHEIKIQRQSIYMPDIILEKFPFFIYTIVKNDLPNPCEWSEKDEGYDYQVTQPNSSFYLKLHNIGLGAAKHISAYFDFDVISSIKLLQAEMNKIPEELRIKVLINNKHVEIKPHSEKSPFGQMYFSNTNYKYSLNHILPASIAKEATHLRIANPYFEFISLSIYLMYATSRPLDGTEVKRMTLIDLPPLILNLTYSDIANQEHKKRFELTFSMSISMLKRIDGSFNIREVNCS